LVWCGRLAGHLKRLFQLIDKDGNGVITIDELRQAAESVRQSALCGEAGETPR
jgi:Ca2+-binding EF-hand superfamily protein